MAFGNSYPFLAVTTESDTEMGEGSKLGEGKGTASPGTFYYVVQSRADQFWR